MFPPHRRMTGAGVLVLAALLALAGCARQQAVAKTAGAETAVPTEAHVPLRVWLDGPTVVSTDQPRDVQLRFEASMALTQLSTAIRGIDGLEVTGGAARQHGARAAGAQTSHPFVLRVPAGISGLVAIDITWERAGANQGATLAVRVGAKGAQPKVEKLGRIEKGRDGQPVLVMPAEMR